MQKTIPLASLFVLAIAGTLSSSQTPEAVGKREPAPGGGAPGVPGSWEVPGSKEVPGSIVSLGSRASHAQVLAGEPQEVYLHLALRAAERPEAPRLGMNLALVIDRSGSMASENKLRFAKSAAEQLVSRLRPDDHLAIVAYDNEIRTVVPSTPAAEAEVFLAAIRGLAPGNSTDLHAGLVSGYEEVLKHFDEERLNALLLISDGLANTGVTDPLEIEMRAARCHDRGVRISTMGMGLAYDEELLLGIAQHAGGNYYYVDQAEAVGRHLDRELDELARVTARDLEVRVVLGPDVELHEVFGYTHRLEGRTVIVPLRDMTSGEGRKIIMRLGTKGVVGARKPLAEASLRYLDAATREPRGVETPALDIGFTERAEEVALGRDLDVLVQVEIVQNAVALDSAMRLQKEGAVRAAQELLAARYLNSKTVNETEYRSPEVERILLRILQVMRELERTRSDPRAGRDLQLTTQLQALGYMGSD